MTFDGMPAATPQAHLRAPAPLAQGSQRVPAGVGSFPNTGEPLGASKGKSRMKDPGFEKVYSRYQKSVGFNQQIDLYNTVENNENFFIGKGLPM